MYWVYGHIFCPMYMYTIQYIYTCIGRLNDWLIDRLTASLTGLFSIEQSDGNWDVGSRNPTESRFCASIFHGDRCTFQN